MTLTEARELGLKTYFNGKDCKYGHSPCGRYVSGRRCVECKKAYDLNRLEKPEVQLHNKVVQKRRKSKPEVMAKHCEEVKRYYRENKEKVSLRNKEYSTREETKIKKSLYNKAYRSNLETLATIQNQQKEYYRNNKSLRIAGSNWYKLCKLRRTPSWANRKAIAEFYNQARQLTEETGILHHVDHIIPLRGKLVSGFHVETNLRVVTAIENLSKNNKLIEQLL